MVNWEGGNYTATSSMFIFFCKVGDLSVNNGSWNKNQWITQKNFNKIAKLNAKDIVDVELLEPAVTTSKNVSSVAFTNKNEEEGKPENASFGGVRQIEIKVNFKEKITCSMCWTPNMETGLSAAFSGKKGIP